ncbi:MAG: hypothetical protein V4692_11320 [Bdellovibrionota bacterium]
MKSLKSVATTLFLGLLVISFQNCGLNNEFKASTSQASKAISSRQPASVLPTDGGTSRDDTTQGGTSDLCKSGLSLESGNRYAVVSNDEKWMIKCVAGTPNSKPACVGEGCVTLGLLDGGADDGSRPRGHTANVTEDPSKNPRAQSFRCRAGVLEQAHAQFSSQLGTSLAYSFYQTTITQFGRGVWEAGARSPASSTDRVAAPCELRTAATSAGTAPTEYKHEGYKGNFPLPADISISNFTVDSAIDFGKDFEISYSVTNNSDQLIEEVSVQPGRAKIPQYAMNVSVSEDSLWNQYDPEIHGGKCLRSVTLQPRETLHFRCGMRLSRPPSLRAGDSLSLSLGASIRILSVPAAPRYEYINDRSNDQTAMTVTFTAPAVTMQTDLSPLVQITNAPAEAKIGYGFKIATEITNPNSSSRVFNIHLVSGYECPIKSGDQQIEVAANSTITHYVIASFVHAGSCNYSKNTINVEVSNPSGSSYRGIASVSVQPLR